MTTGEAAAEDLRPPLWAWPALLIGQLHRTLARSVRPDVELIHRLPGRIADDTVVPAIAIALVVVFSWLRLGIHDVFTESIVFVVAALALGLLAPSLGVIIVLFHVVGDLARTFGSLPPDVDALGVFGVVGGRFVSYYLLWLLVVEVPLIARAVPWAAMASERPAGERSRRVVSIGSSLIAVALMTFVWMLAVPVLIRPVFTWGLARTPTIEATSSVQQWGPALIAAAVAIAAILSTLRLRLSRADQAGPVSFEEFEDFDLDQLEGGTSQPVELATQVVRHALAIIVLGGLVSGVVQLAMVAGSVLISRPLATRLLRVAVVRTTLAWIPWILRFLIGFALTYILGAVVTTLRYEPLNNAELPLVGCVAFGLFVFQVLLNAGAPERPTETAPPAAQPTPAAGAVGMALLIAVSVALAAPATVAADEEITASGPLRSVRISSDLGCQVTHTADETPEFYGGEIGSCGTFVAVGGTLYSPSSIALGPTFTPVRQERSGAGTASDPYRIVTVVTLGETDLTLTETDSYVSGGEFYRTDVQIANASGDDVTVIVYRGGDCYLQNADVGFGSVDARAGAVRCVGVADPTATTPVPGVRIEEWVPITPGSSYLQAGYSEVWSAVGAQQPFPNTCRCDQLIDNGAGLSWSLNIPAGGNATVSHLTNFSPTGQSVVAVPASIPAGAAAGAAAVGTAVAVGLSGSAMQQSDEQRARRQSRRRNRGPRERRQLPGGGIVQRLKEGALRDFRA
ncbi:MAG: hypothetical protein ABR509_07355 [Candidatus Limnocylindria bacterium]